VANSPQGPNLHVTQNTIPKCNAEQAIQIGVVKLVESLGCAPQNVNCWAVIDGSFSSALTQEQSAL